MMHISKLFLLQVTLVIALALSSCKDNEPITNPCDSYKRPTASFIVQDEAQQKCSFELGIICACDTLISMKEYTFTSEINYETYLWEVIGNPSFTRTNKSFTITFPDPLTINMRLIGKRKTNTTCDPNDDGFDTIIKTIKVLNPSTDSSSIIYGKYVGFDVAYPNVEVGMEIVYEKPPISNTYELVIKYFPDSCPNLLIPAAGSTGSYNLMFLNNQTRFGCQSPRGWFFFTPSGVDIQYTTLDIATPGSMPVKRRFIGKRIK